MSDPSVKKPEGEAAPRARAQIMWAMCVRPVHVARGPRPACARSLPMQGSEDPRRRFVLLVYAHVDTFVNFFIHILGGKKEKLGSRLYLI